MKEFVGKLWDNQNIQNVPLVKKENHILSFIKENQASLRQAFSQDQFFPGLGWDDTVRLLLTELTDRIVESVRPLVEEVLERSNHPELREHFQDEGGLQIDTGRFRDSILAGMRGKVLRDQYLTVLTALRAGYFSNYIPSIISRRKMIYIELVRRDKLNLEPTALGEYLSLASLLRPNFFIPIDTPDRNAVILQKHHNNRKLYEQTVNVLRANLMDEIGHIPDSLLTNSLESCMNLSDHPDLSGASRLIRILMMRAMEYAPGVKQDRGAESPDKSWFSINRRTAKYNGLDSRFLEELYLIAGEEGW